MIALQASKRKETKRKVKELLAKGMIPAILYGPQTKEMLLSVEKKQFDKIFRDAGESTLVSLQIENEEKPVLIYDLQRDPITGQVTHVDFYQPSLNKKIEIMVPLVFEGDPPAVKDLGGTLIKNIQEMRVRALPQELPHELKVSVAKLLTFDDRVLVKDIEVLPNVEFVGHNLEDIVAQVVPPEKVEEELATPVEEKVEEVEKVEKPKKEEIPEEGVPTPKAGTSATPAKPPVK